MYFPLDDDSILANFYSSKNRNFAISLNLISKIFEIQSVLQATRVADRYGSLEII